MTGRPAPRSAFAAIRAIRDEATPPTVLASVQSAWAEVVGPAIAAEAEPVSERDGVVTVACRSATWAQELDLMQDRIVTRLNASIGAVEQGSETTTVRRLRLTADRSRFYS
jgi:predicted nucleic acid-binding Zn ribbon protein